MKKFKKCFKYSLPLMFSHKFHILSHLKHDQIDFLFPHKDKEIQISTFHNCFSKSKCNLLNF